MSSPKWETKVGLRLETSLSNTPKSWIKKKRKNQSAPPTGSRNKIKQVLVSFANSSFLSNTNSSAAEKKTRKLCPNKSHCFQSTRQNNVMWMWTSSPSSLSITPSFIHHFQWSKFFPNLESEFDANLCYLLTYLPTLPICITSYKLASVNISHNMQLFLRQMKDPKTNPTHQLPPSPPPPKDSIRSSISFFYWWKFAKNRNSKIKWIWKERKVYVKNLQIFLYSIFQCVAKI
jgi:hypothetical protein